MKRVLYVLISITIILSLMAMPVYAEECHEQENCNEPTQKENKQEKKEKIEKNKQDNLEETSSAEEEQDTTVEDKDSAINAEKKSEINRKEDYDASNTSYPEDEKEAKENSSDEDSQEKQNKRSTEKEYQTTDELDGSLEEDVRHPDVITLKENMTLLGFGGMNINDLFGSYTAKRVRDLQTYYGLEVTGKGDKPTLDKINSILSSPYRQGERHKDVITLKENLTALGYGNMNINDLYGSFTETRVQQFQRDHGLVVNGIVDPVTEAKINSYFPDVLKEGVRSPQVIELKRKLITLGFGGMNVNDLYGSFTAKRVRQLKEYYGIDPSDDIVDSKVFEQIDEIISSSIKEGDRHSDVIELKEALVFLGYGGMNINDLYGSFTVTRVKQFQKDNGLTVNGLIDPVTRDLLESNRGIYYEGNRHPSIIEFKEKLTHLGFGNMNINNYYGSFTTTRVKQFQKYYGLKQTGTGTPETLQKLDELYNTHLQEGKRHSSVISFKQKLIKLGFGNMNVNETYGSFTAKRVRQFQEHYGLRVNGIGDDRTLAKIDEILSTNFQEGRKHKDVIQLKKDLTSLGYGGMNINETYGSFTAKKVKEFQKDHNLPQSGIADEKTLEKIEELLYAINYSHYDYSLEEALNIQMNQMAQTDKGEYAWVSKSYIDSNNRVTASALNVRTQPTTSNEMSNRILGTLSKGTKVEIIDQKGNWYAIKYNNSSWVHAVREDVRYYLNPNNFINDNRQKFQFLDLSKPSGASRSVLNNYLKGRGVLSNQGQAFIDAARTHGVNDIYLISHSVLETGHGTSTLAKGVEVGVNKDGKPVLVTKSNRKSLKNIKTVYNMYGIGAVDSNPLGGGAIRAYNEGWDTVEKAIIGGAKFIGNNYIKNGQNTLYKMRWNPKMNEGMAWKQYATDIGWASKQVHTMYNLYQEIGHNNPILDIPVYK